MLPSTSPVPSPHDLVYLELMRRIRAHGDYRMERTGTGAYSLFAQQLRFDLTDGSFPLLTTKKVHLRSIIHELLWFLKGDTNIKYLNDNGVTIWDEWANPDGDLGPCYGYQWRQWGEWSTQRLEKKAPVVKRLEDEIPPFCDYDVSLPEAPVITDAGKDERNRALVKVVFPRSCYSYTIRKDHAERGVRDPYAPSKCGVGCLGEDERTLGIPETVLKNLIACWNKMMERCYDPKCKEYRFYGAIGVKVCRRWLCRSAFLSDATKLPWFEQKSKDLAGYQLDKDHLGDSTYYSPTTCAWVPEWVNSAYAHTQPFVATAPDGTEYYHISPSVFGSMHQLSGHSICRCLRGERPHHFGWKFCPVEDRGLRFSSPTDQIKQLVEGIVKSPYGRRHIVSAWNVKDLPTMKLPPCHCLFQCFVSSKGRLSLHLYQRSADYLLGVPFNIASYALLLLMLAQATGNKPGELVITFGDVHLYSNHLEQADLQLSRAPFGAPRMEIGDSKDIFGFKYEDFKLLDYTSHASIKAAIAV